MTQDHFGPLPVAEGEYPIRRGKFIDIEAFGLKATKIDVVSGTLGSATVTGTLTGGTITGTTITGASISGTTVTGGSVVGSDFYSDNWESGGGTVPLSLASRDAGATAGFALDGSAGGAQFVNIFADGGELRTLEILGTLTMGANGVFRSASSGKRVEIATTETGHIRFYTDASGETIAAGIYGSGATNPDFTLMGGTRSAAAASTIEFDSTNTQLKLIGSGDTAGGLHNVNLTLIGGASPSFTLSGLRNNVPFTFMSGSFDGTDTQVTLADITQEAWTAPTLLNSWVDYGAGYQTARYRKDASGVVHIQGLIKSGTTTISTILFTLPSGYRPDATILNMCGQYDNVYGRIDVASNGNVSLGNAGSATWQNITLSFAT